MKKAPSSLAAPEKIVWAGKTITFQEYNTIQQVKESLSTYKFQSHLWKDTHFFNNNNNNNNNNPNNNTAVVDSHSVTHSKQGILKDIEILRFLRSHHGKLQETIDSLKKHDLWRISTPYGAEASFTVKAFATPAAMASLQKEIFWLEDEEDDCPTLVMRTQIHDGYYYNDDPEIYTSFLVSKLEEGRQRFGIGTKQQMCILMDRGGIVYKNGERKKEVLDIRVMGSLMKLFLNLNRILSTSYPEILYRTRMAPVSTFFSTCVNMALRILPKEERSRFVMIKEKELEKEIHSIYHPRRLPEHLKGTSSSYSSIIFINFDPLQSYFPLNSKNRSKQVQKDSGFSALEQMKSISQVKERNDKIIEIEKKNGNIR